MFSFKYFSATPPVLLCYNTYFIYVYGIRLQAVERKELWEYIPKAFLCE